LSNRSFELAFEWSAREGDESGVAVTPVVAAVPKVRQEDDAANRFSEDDSPGLAVESRMLLIPTQ
jgi:hypothetical protein